MPTTIPILTATFSPTIAPWEVNAFRGAFLEKMKEMDDHNQWFHNHEENGQSSYVYPRVQYKQEMQKPIFICFQEAIKTGENILKNEAYHELAIKAFNKKVQYEGYQVKSYKVGIADTMDYTYKIQNWLALNQKNYETYKDLNDLKAENDFLSKKLIGNMLTFAKAIHWHVEENIEVMILSKYKTNFPKFKGQKFSAFNLDFKTNMLLPDQIGLGKGVSHGFGTIKSY